VYFVIAVSFTGSQRFGSLSYFYMFLNYSVVGGIVSFAIYCRQKEQNRKEITYSQGFTVIIETCASRQQQEVVLH